MARKNEVSNAAETRSLNAFNKWFNKSDLPGSHRASAHDAWLEAEKRTISNARRARSKLENQLDEVKLKLHKRTAALSRANARLQKIRSEAKLETDPSSGGLKLGPGDR